MVTAVRRKRSRGGICETLKLASSRMKKLGHIGCQHVSKQQAKMMPRTMMPKLFFVLMI